MSRRLAYWLGRSSFAASLVLVSCTCLAATIDVNTTADVINATDGLCSLREAIIAANTNTASGGLAGECAAGSGTDTINLPSGTYTLTIAPSGANDATTGDLNITESVNIVATGTPTVQGGAGWADGIFDITGTASVSMSGFIVSGGNRNISSGVSGGGGIRDTASGALTLTNMVIQNNTVTSSGGALSPGGGIFASGPSAVTIIDSTLTGNTAAENGGGIYTNSTLIMTGTTVSNNHAVGSGFSAVGGVDAFLPGASGTVTITNSTITGNTGVGTIAAAGVDIEWNTALSATLNNVTISGNSNPSRGGLSMDGASGGTVTISNVIVAGNSGSVAPDCGVEAGSGTINSGGNNLIGNNTGCTLTGTQVSDKIGTSGSPIDPLLGAPANNGGPTQTMALLAGSPAIDAGSNATCEATDQRGISRPQGPSCDIGAFEVAQAPPPVAPIATPTLSQTLIFLLAALLALASALRLRSR